MTLTMTLDGPCDDETLVGRVRSGDVRAFEELYRRHAGAVRTAVRDNVHDAEGIADVVQETFARALARLDSLREPSRFRPWLLSIGRHAAIDNRRHSTRVRSLDDQEAMALPSGADGPDVAAELAELGALLQSGVATLSARDATALSMVTHLGLRPAEVAAALGVTTGAAAVIVHRARRRLRDAVVLEVLVRAAGAGCHEFERLHGPNPVAAARHIKDCTECCRAALAEVVPFDAGRAVAGNLC
jgi:RNA polymerase sigma factor (sigma-70 family)